jgi:hypothetical protein
VPIVLDALARVLRLSADERAHLYALARGERPPLDQTPDEAPDATLERVLRSLPDDAPAYVLGRRWDVLAWNRGASELLVDFDARPPTRRNLLELTFLDEELRNRYADWEQLARSTLANFRASVGRNLDLPEVQQLVAHLKDADPQFATWWRLHEIQEKTAGVKRFHGKRGEIVDMRFETVLSPTAQDQRLILYTPASTDR